MTAHFAEAPHLVKVVRPTSESGRRRPVGVSAKGTGRARREVRCPERGLLLAPFTHESSPVLASRSRIDGTHVLPQHGDRLGDTARDGPPPSPCGRLARRGARAAGIPHPGQPEARPRGRREGPGRRRPRASPRRLSMGLDGVGGDGRGREGRVETHHRARCEVGRERVHRRDRAAVGQEPRRLRPLEGFHDHPEPGPMRSSSGRIPRSSSSRSRPTGST